MDLQGAEKELAHVSDNADLEEEMGTRWEALANDSENGPYDFRIEFGRLGRRLRESNMTLSNYALTLASVLSALKTVKGTIKALKKEVKRNVKTDLKTANDLKALLEEYRDNLPEELIEELENDIACLQEENPELLEATDRISSHLIGTNTSRFKQMVLLATLALGSAQVGSCVQEETGQSPFELAYEKITEPTPETASPSDSQ